MRKSYLYILAAGLLVLGAACSKTTDENTNSTSNENESVMEENVNAAVNTNSASDDRTTNDNTNSSDDTTNTNSSGDHQQVSSGSLKVTSPETNDEVESPIEVEGTSDTDVVYVRAKNSSGTALFTETVTVRKGEFHVNLTLSLTSTKAITLDVFQKDSSGAEKNLVSIPVNVKVELSNTNTSDDSVNTNANENTNDDHSSNENDNSSDD